MKLVFLGIGGTLPTRDRNLSSVAVEIGKIRFLLDCGEGTQKQLMKSNFSYMKLDAIFLSHFHGDHILGIPGLLQTLSLNSRQKELYIIGPPGTVKLIQAMEEISFYSRSFPLHVAEVSPGESFTLFGVKVDTLASEHSLPGLIYRLSEPTPKRVLSRDAIREVAKKKGVSPGELYREYMEKLERGEDVDEELLGVSKPGRVLVYTGDTAYFPGLLDFSKGVDVLISEATFPSEMGERAKEWGHMTVAQAAKLGRDAEVRYLFLVHFSPRIKGEEGVEEVRREAKAIFPRAVVPEELAEYVIKKRR
ncbi:MAG: ribonuclease Z [Thermoplasmata archaeon]|nr:ribonuclease Z [Thermoplasmata archaeon]